MLLKPVFSAVAAVVSFVTYASADVSPNYPGPGTVWTAGKANQITWINTEASTGDWSNFTIDFMTGDNINMVRITNVATGLDGSNANAYTWTPPQVDPYSAIYFFQFTPASGAAAWTTRFAIVANDGDVPVKEPNPNQPTGEAIPWGVGKLAAPLPSSAEPTGSTSASESSSVSESSAIAAAAEESSTTINTKTGDDHGDGAMNIPSMLTIFCTSALIVMGCVIA